VLVIGNNVLQSQAILSTFGGNPSIMLVSKPCRSPMLKRYINRYCGRVGASMTNDNDESDADMAECGACRAIIPADSNSCPECNVSFTGLSEEDMGECGACGALVAIESKSCSQCGVQFVLDDLTSALSGWMKKEGHTVSSLFGEVDTDGDGSLSADELKSALKSRSLAFLPSQDLERFISQIDLDSDGSISFGELAAALLLSDDATDGDAEADDEDDAEAETTDDAEAETTDDAEAETTDDAESEDTVEDETDDDEDDESDEEDDSDADSDDDEDDSDEDDSEDDVDDSDEDDSEDDEDDSEDEESDEDADDEEESSASDVFMRLVTAIEESGETAVAVFENLDRNESQHVSPDEFKSVVAENFSEDFSEEDLDVIIASLDSDDDGYIDIIELTEALEKPEDIVEKIEKPKREGPAEWQRFLMRHYENIFPIFYALMAIWIVLWLVNGIVGPFDGSGGPIAYDGEYPGLYEVGEDANGDTLYEQVLPDEIYPCFEAIQESKCANSLTPLAGEASSMPVRFYWDGIVFMILGLLGCVGIGFLQMKTKKWREESRSGKSTDEDEDEDEGGDSEEDEDEDDDADEDEDDDADEDDEDDDADEDDEDDDEEEDEDDDDGEEEDEEIEIGSRVGVEFDGESEFGEVVGFNDDDDEVVVKLEDGEEVTVSWDDLFVE